MAFSLLVTVSAFAHEADELESTAERGTANAELRSGQDLENFATGVLLRDENIEELQIADEGLAMGYRMPGKFLGVFGASFRIRAEIKSDGEIKVRFPWYGFLYKKRVGADEIKTNMETHLQKEGGSNSVTHKLPGKSASQTGELISVMQESLRGAHDKSHRLLRGN